MSTADKKKLGAFSAFCVLIIATVFNFETAAINPVLANIQMSFPDEPLVKITLISAAPFIGSIIFSIVCGKLVEKWSKKWVVVIGLAIYGVLGILPGFVDGINLILVLRLFVGIGVGLCLPIPAMILADHYEGEDLKKMNGRMSFVFQIANGVISIVVGALGIINWKFAFYAFAFMLVVMVFAIIGVPNDKPKKLETADANAEKVGMGKTGPIMLLANIGLWAAFATILLGASFINMERGLVPMAAIGIIAALPGVFDAIAALCYQKMSKIRMFIPLGLILMAIGFLVFGFASNGVMFVAGCIIMGFGHGLLVPHVVTFTGMATPAPARDKALGLVQAGIHLGALFTAVVVSMYVDNAPVENGWVSVYVIETVILVIMAIIFAIKAAAKKKPAAE